MAEYLDTIFTDEDLTSKEFIDAINKDLADITGYKSDDTIDNTIDDTINKPIKKQNDSDVDPLDEVFKKEEVEITEIDKTILDELSNEEKVKYLRRPRSKASIAIDEDGDIICKSWGNYYISGNHDTTETATVINEYFKECDKPLNQRDLSKFIVGRKTIIEKFNDMNLKRGEINVNDFLEDVV